jgi:hypothetical protein
MSRYPGATWRGPVPNMVTGAMAGYRLFVVHIQEGSEAGTDAWFHNPQAQASSHFGNPKAGAPDQWVDTADRAWAEAAYNDVAISIENEGKSGESLTAPQIENAAQILAWCHRVHGIALQVTDDPNGSGVIGHGLLGTAGGGHFDCPGAPILRQRQAIVDRAAQIIQGADMPLSPQDIAAVAKAVYEYGEENVALPDGRVVGASLGNLAHGAWVAVNDAKSGNAAIAAALAKASAPVDAKALAAAVVAGLGPIVQQAVAAGVQPDYDHMAVVAEQHLAATLAQAK